MADEAAVEEEVISPAQSPLVTVTFQRNSLSKEKFLEAEPKALGITQIGLSVYMIVCLTVLRSNGLSLVGADIALFVSSPLVIIAGSTALAAQKLHLPTLRACLGMQIVACAASIVNTVSSLIIMGNLPFFCWRYHYSSSASVYGSEVCEGIEKINSHFFAGSVLIHAALFAIAATLSAYCCKAVRCCGPPPKTPVITVQAPPAQE